MLMADEELDLSALVPAGAPPTPDEDDAASLAPKCKECDAALMASGKCPFCEPAEPTPALVDLFKGKTLEAYESLTDEEKAVFHKKPPSVKATVTVVLEGPLDEVLARLEKLR